MKILFLLFVFVVHVFAADCVISHHNCDYDSNCGLTCSQLYQKELSNDPGFVPPPGHYEDFISMCMTFYFPGGCSSGSGDSPGFDSSGTVWLNLAGVDSASYSRFWSDFGLGFSDVAPFVWSLLGLFLIIRMISMVLK